MRANFAAGCRVVAFCLSAFVALWIAETPAAAVDIDECAKLLQKGEYDQCLAECEAAIATGAYGEGWRLLKADAELATGRYQQARETLEKAIETYTWSAKLRIRLRDALRFTGDAAEVLVLDAKIAQLVESTPWRFTDADNLVLLGGLALEMGGDAKEVQTAFFERARRNNPVHRLPRLALGRLALDKRDFALAADLFREAVTTFPDDPDFLFGLALALDSSAPDEAEKLREQIVAINPRYIPLLLDQADHLIEAEDYDEAESKLSDVLGINEHHPAALAYLAVIAHLRNDAEAETELRGEALSTWATNPEVDHIIGRELSQKYRFAEGADRQRTALEFDPNYRPAQKQLASDLLRLGREEEGWQIASAAYEADQYDVTLYNLVMLRDSLAKFATLERDGFILRMDETEAGIYGQRALDLLAEARRELTERYRVELKQPIVVEIFPRPADFAVRTFGMPGVVGYLGVCFGNVITANSPASQELTPANWESVLWHEFTHVITLNLTHNRMPRWVSEGISVWEERRRDKAWGERMTSTYRQMILGGDLTPVGELSGAFLNPKSPAHVQFAYFESSLVIEYLVEQYGFEALHEVLVDLGAGVPINDALERRTAPLAELEPAFEAHMTELAKSFAPGVDWSPPILDGAGAPDERLRNYIRDNPNNYSALTMYADLLIRQEKYADAELILRKLLLLNPTATGLESPALKLAGVLRETGRTEDERQILADLVQIDDAAPSAYLRLMELEAAREDWEAVRVNAMRLRAVDPLTPHSHRYLATAAEQLGQPDVALEALQSLLAVSADDPAGTNYRIARILHEQGDTAHARRHVLMSLEEAPRYRDAQKLLLEIVEPVHELGDVVR